MRERRAAENNLTIYAMARNKKLYPLEKYLDAADLAIERNKANLKTFKQWMSDEDEGMRWWASVGLNLLEKDARGASAILKKALTDESHEVRILSAWTLIKTGQSDQALATLDKLLFQGTENEPMLHNVIDWMGEPALPLVKKYIDNGGSQKGKYGISILARIAQVQDW